MSLPSTRFFAKVRRIPRPKAWTGVVFTPGDACPELTDEQRPRCQCSKPMQVRKSGKSVFWSCPRFPVCKFTRPIDSRKFAFYQNQRRLEQTVSKP